MAVALLAAVAAGCGGGELDVDGRPRLASGDPAPPGALSIARAIQVGPARPLLVRGYLKAPADDVMRLCSGFDGDGYCPEPSLEVRGLDVTRVAGLEEGCCALGSWSRHELALRGVVSRGVFYVSLAQPAR